MIGPQGESPLAQAALDFVLSARHKVYVCVVFACLLEGLLAWLKHKSAMPASSRENPSLAERRAVVRRLAAAGFLAGGEAEEDLAALLRQWESGTVHGKAPGSPPIDPNRPTQTIHGLARSKPIPD